MRSSMPPWPGRIAPESFTPAPRLISDSTRSPSCAATFRMSRTIIGPIAGCSSPNSPSRRSISPAQERRTQGQSVVKQEPSHADAGRKNRSRRALPRFLGTDARRHQMPPDRLAHEIREDVSRPNHQQQIQQIKRPRPLLAKLHQHPHGQRNVSERKGRCRRCRISAAQIRAPHRRSSEKETAQSPRQIPGNRRRSRWRAAASHCPRSRPAAGRKFRKNVVGQRSGCTP
jgi:hypothetical protein